MRRVFDAPRPSRVRGLFLASFLLLSAGAAGAQQRQAGAAAGESGAPREALAAYAVQKRAEAAVSEKKLLAPAAEDEEAHAEFLKAGGGRGLLRLLPRGVYDGKLSMRGGGAYYSFARLTHEYGYGSDLELSGGRLSTGFAGADFGFLVDLGDVPLEALTRESPGVRHLAEYKTPRVERKARDEYQRSVFGFEADGFTYRKNVPVRVDNTYALRSVNYGGSDLLVALRVVRVDSDGSVVLLWKILKRYTKPELDIRNISPELQ